MIVLKNGFISKKMELKDLYMHRLVQFMEFQKKEM